MTRSFVTALAVVCSFAAGLPHVVAAQTIHGDPQDAAYASPAEWPTISSQCHWLAPNVNAMGTPAHTHVDMKFPLYAEESLAPFTVPFTLTMYHTAGKITTIEGTLGNVVTLNAGKVLPLAGDPMGVVAYTGTVTFNPSLGVASGAVPKHGWYPALLRVVTQYNNRDVAVNQLRLSVYSVIDVTQPEVKPGDGTGIRTTSNCQVTDFSDPQNLGNARWQSNIMEFLQILPVLGPITPGTPWKMFPLAYNYGAVQGLPPGIFELRVDPDIHNGIPGTTIDSQTGSSVVGLPDVLPNNVPDGTHKLMWMWRRPNFGGDKELDSLIVFLVNVGPGGAAQPPNNSQVPGPPPPQPPPPPPPPPHPIYRPIQ
jgi:hypothetical protein